MQRAIASVFLALALSGPAIADPPAGAATAAPAVAPAADLARIIADFGDFEKANDPITAGFEGDRAALARLPDASPAAEAARKTALEGFKRRLDALDATKLDAESRLNRDFLGRVIALRLDSFRFDLNRIPFQNDSGFYSLADYLASATPIRSRADADAWLARLEAYPAYLAVNTENMRRGVRTGFMQSKPVVEAALVSLRALPETADQSPLLDPFKSLPASIPAADADALRQRLRTLVADKVLPAQREVRRYMEQDYLPRAPTRLAFRDKPDGAAFYMWSVRYHTTTNMTPDEVHALGLKEVARIRGRMDEVIRETGFKGTFPEFLQMLRTDPRFYPKTGEELLMRTAEIAKRADDRLPAYFRTLPRLTYGVRPVPDALAPAYTTGRYFSGSPEQGIAGGLMINTTKLDQRPLYELPALALHEGVPGHHLQIALSQERTDLPWFRRNADVTAFVEGWGLYAEYLGEEMGIYRDPYEKFGRLSYEMWRACRLVADTGIHWKRWTLPQARKCFEENSALSPHNITTELERYASWPGQADAYKIGEIEFRRLRAKAEAELGDRFDVRDFHDAVLRDGPLPLDLLDRRIDAWILARKQTP